MGQFQKPETQYVTVAASVTTAPVGNVGCYLESVTIIPVSTAARGRHHSRRFNGNCLDTRRGPRGAVSSL
jgi:uncharacterized RmlC-like cupin family protein